ncbi:hypothetical protein N7532_003325 [Penicillium argentinense]|uniref:Dienelactone hydrolase n=1 Tax=Penicillium argentinense TaxID=1131581 RepID=A0A9W9KEE8_9EURO|nr:uncharacterized protein N7532_003325 [Penicillium argentinense]KAJ5102796.1 hypothetical protein N7532_003325 [Penicillium argentinense]
MVNVFQRLTRRATSSTQKPRVARSTSHGRLRRSLSVSSNKRTRRAPAEEPAPKHLLLISDTPEFDHRIIHRYQAEGFDVEYLSFSCTGDPERDRKHLDFVVHEREDELEAGERYAIVAYNRPAYYLLASHHLATSNTNPFPRLCALIAYYPLTSTSDLPPGNCTEECIPACCDTSAIFEPGPETTYLPIQIHIPGNKADKSTIWPWITISSSEGDVTYKKRHRCYLYNYPDAGFRFAEPEFACVRKDSQGFRGEGEGRNEVCESLAWSRVLGCLRRAFGVGSNWAVVDIETVWEEYWGALLEEVEIRKNGHDNGSVNKGSILGLVSGGEYALDGGEHGHEPSVECAPTKAGGAGIDSLRSFFSHVFIPAGPANQQVRLLSRTVGADRIVDEISFSFVHTAEVPWLLPGVSPTLREIKVVIVVVASFCADKIVNQSLYWDQADVLVQAGILDPALVPKMSGVQ